MAHDVFKIFKDLELKAVGVEPGTNKMQEGYFSSFRSIGLPINKEDYANPWSPTGPSTADIPVTPPVDPKDADPKTASSKLDPNVAYAANIAKSQQNYLNTFMLLDDKLRMNDQYAVMPSSSKLSDSWFAIVNGANGIPPTMELNEEMKKSYDAARAKLADADGNPTRQYENYLRYELEYEDAVVGRNKAYADALTNPTKLAAFPINGVVYQDRVEKALDRWTALGAKVEIEKAINTLAAQGTDPAIILIARAKKKFMNSLNMFMGIGEVPYTMVLPRSWCNPDADDGWTEYSMHDLHTQSHYDASSTSYGGSAGVNLGLWSGGASFSHADSHVNATAQMNNLNIRFSYCAADIKRPWLDTSLLNLKNWFLAGDYKANCISSGKMGQELPAGNVEPSFLPSLTTSLILVKDVYISWDDWKTQWSQHTSSNTGSASVGVLCFTAGASYSHSSVQRDFSYDDSGESLHIPGIQLIGYVSAINPPSPRINSSDYQQQVHR